MNTLRVYLLSGFVAVVLSLTMANMTAMAWCQAEAHTYS
jgi:hypothetical protein